jgi:hypothetical protein
MENCQPRPQYSTRYRFPPLPKLNKPVIDLESIREIEADVEQRLHNYQQKNLNLALPLLRSDSMQRPSAASITQTRNKSKPFLDLERFNDPKPDQKKLDPRVDKPDKSDKFDKLDHKPDKPDPRNGDRPNKPDPSEKVRRHTRQKKTEVPDSHPWTRVTGQKGYSSSPGENLFRDIDEMLCRKGMDTSISKGREAERREQRMASQLIKRPGRSDSISPADIAEVMARVRAQHGISPDTDLSTQIGKVTDLLARNLDMLGEFLETHQYLQSLS